MDVFVHWQQFKSPNWCPNSLEQSQIKVKTSSAKLTELHATLMNNESSTQLEDVTSIIKDNFDLRHFASARDVILEQLANTQHMCCALSNKIGTSLLALLHEHVTWEKVLASYEAFKDTIGSTVDEDCLFDEITALKNFLAGDKIPEWNESKIPIQTRIFDLKIRNDFVLAKDNLATWSTSPISHLETLHVTISENKSTRLYAIRAQRSVPRLYSSRANRSMSAVSTLRVLIAQCPPSLLFVC
uniref:Uncharacterized protein n=1 Tax=Timema poppense TaxID=170557 RepID=A0A7R9DEW5_TIMPO|nr:unnamed protein product [Timema poppensis]